MFPLIFEGSKKYTHKRTINMRHVARKITNKIKLQNRIKEYYRRCEIKVRKPGSGIQVTYELGKWKPGQIRCGEVATKDKSSLVGLGPVMTPLSPLSDVAHYPCHDCQTCKNCHFMIMTNNHIFVIL